MKLKTAGALAVLLSMLIGCAFFQSLIPVPVQPTATVLPTPPAERPLDFSIEYHWSEGTIAPPYYYEYSIKINSTGEGEIKMIPNYPGGDSQAPVWDETFSVSQEQLDGLYQLMRARGLWSQEWQDLGGPPPGGGSESVIVHADGRDIETPDYEEGEQEKLLQEIYQAINALVPREIWDKLMAQRDQYIEAHREP